MRGLRNIVNKLLKFEQRQVRIVRRQYRLDLPAPCPCSMAREVEDVLALAEVIGKPMVVVGRNLLFGGNRLHPGAVLGKRFRHRHA